jgi:hypothetical protein
VLDGHERLEAGFPAGAAVEARARATARRLGLPIEEAWWPSVLEHLTGLLEPRGEAGTELAE